MDVDGWLLEEADIQDARTYAPVRESGVGALFWLRSHFGSRDWPNNHFFGTESAGPLGSILFFRVARFPSAPCLPVDYRETMKTTGDNFVKSADDNLIKGADDNLIKGTGDNFVKGTALLKI